MTPLICINSNPSLTNSTQLREGKKYYPFFYMHGFKPGQVLVLLKDVDGAWELDRFIPESVDFEIERQVFDALKTTII